MRLSIFLARAWGLYLLIICLAFLVNRKNLQRLLRVYKSEEVILFTGGINLVIGVLMVFSHNLWVSDWRVIITLFGFIALAKGIVRLFWPEFVTKRIVKKIDKLKATNWLSILLLIALVLGAYLAFIGFTS